MAVALDTCLKASIALEDVRVFGSNRSFEVTTQTQRATFAYTARCGGGRRQVGRRSRRVSAFFNIFASSDGSNSQPHDWHALLTETVEMCDTFSQASPAVFSGYACAAPLPTGPLFVAKFKLGGKQMRRVALPLAPRRMTVHRRLAGSSPV
uniref:Uncharacterized protein n=1 Tax=Plectus sambesii TaxID=2011161 RepID=A0A914WHV2_9BILA